jgi:hypothetical protein
MRKRLTGKRLGGGTGGSLRALGAASYALFTRAGPLRVKLLAAHCLASFCLATLCLASACLKAGGEIEIVDSGLGKRTPAPATPTRAAAPSEYFIDAFVSTLVKYLELGTSDASSLVESVQQGLTGPTVSGTATTTELGLAMDNAVAWLASTGRIAAKATLNDRIELGTILLYAAYVSGEEETKAAEADSLQAHLEEAAAALARGFSTFSPTSPVVPLEYVDFVLYAAYDVTVSVKNAGLDATLLEERTGWMVAKLASGLSGLAALSDGDLQAYLRRFANLSGRLIADLAGTSDTTRTSYLAVFEAGIRASVLGVVTQARAGSLADLRVNLESGIQEGPLQLK